MYIRERHQTSATVGAWKTLALGLCALAAATALWPSPTRAYSPIPPFPGPGGVATSEVAVDPALLREMLATYVSPVGAKYSVLFVEYSDRENRSGPDFGDADQGYISSIVEQWGRTADRESSIFIVMSMSNHDIIVHPFPRFAALGWEGDAVKATIDDSPFALYARAGDPVQAVMALVHSIDAELVAREQRARDQRVRLERLLQNARIAVASFEQDSLNSRFELAAVRAEAEALTTKVRRAETAIARADWPTALRDGEQIRAQTTALTGWSERLEEADGRARRQLEELTRQRDQVTRHPLRGDSEQARVYVASADRERRAAEGFLARGEVESAAAPLTRASTSLARALVTLDREATRQLIWYRVVPGAVLLCALALLLMWLLGRHKRTRELRALAEESLRELDAALGYASEKLVALENEHALFLSGATAAADYTGASQGPVREAASRVDDLFIEFEAATRIAKEARERLASAGRFGVRAAQSAFDRLTSEPIVVRTEQVTERKLLLPDERQVTRRPSELLTQLERTYSEVTRLLAALGERIGAVHEQLAELATALGEADAALTRTTQRTPTANLDPVFDDVEGERLRLLAQAKLDPIGCEAGIAALGPKIDALLTRMRAFDEASHTVCDVLPKTIAGVEAQVATLRSQGRKLSEAGFEPDSRVADLRHKARVALTAIASGDAELARSSATEALAATEELTRAITDSEAGRALSPARITEQRSRAEAHRARLAERRERIEGLRLRYADESLVPALDNVVEAEPLLAQAFASLASAERELDPTRQGYLAAKRAIDRTTIDLDGVGALFAEIEGKASELEALLVRADTHLDASVTILESVATTFEACGSRGRAELRPEAGERFSELDALRTLRAAERIAVPTLASRAEALFRRLSEYRTTVELELAAIRDAEARREALTAAVTWLADTLAQSTDDRAETNAAFDAAKDDFARLVQRWDAEMLVPSTLVDRLIALRETFDKVRQRASDDVEAAVAARADFARGHAALRTAEALLPAWRRGEADRARAELAEAQRLLDQRDYAGARARAASAIRGAEATVYALRQEQAAAAIAESFARDVARASTRSWGSPSSSHSSSGRSSFGSSSSSHSSSGRSSSGSSSGRSSFGSSSGRSSYGSSSGRSKW